LEWDFLFRQLSTMPLANRHPHDSSPRGVFITGTDTGVGKTLVTSALVTCLKQQGIDVGVMKPIETGMSPSPKAPSDGSRLRKAAGCHDPMTEVSPYRFRLPLAPLSAARAEGRTVLTTTIIRIFQTLLQKHSLVVVEGAGGVYVPITQSLNMADLIHMMKLPAVVIGHSGLGGVNHALLTIQALRERKIPVLALVLNQLRPVLTRTESLQELSTVTLLRRLAKVPVVGPIAYSQGFNRHRDKGLSQLAETSAITGLARLIQASGQETPSRHR
jgi:dethiobiotin synthetase